MSRDATMFGQHPRLRSGVNLGLTRRRRRYIETAPFAAFVRRVVAALARRVAEGCADDLTDLVTISRDVDQAIHAAVDGLRSQGYSWADIARRIGVTRQAAQQRWGGLR